MCIVDMVVGLGGWGDVGDSLGDLRVPTHSQCSDLKAQWAANLLPCAGLGGPRVQCTFSPLRPSCSLEYGQTAQSLSTKQPTARIFVQFPPG